MEEPSGHIRSLEPLEKNHLDRGQDAHNGFPTQATFPSNKKLELRKLLFYSGTLLLQTKFSSVLLANAFIFYL